MADWLERVRWGRWSLTLFGVFTVLLGLPLTYMGVQLLALGGSWYYALAGVALISAGLLYVLGRWIGALVLAATLAATVVWALAEVGLQFWPLVPRILSVAVLAAIGLVVAPAFKDLPPGRRVARSLWGSGVALGALSVVTVAAMFVPHGGIAATGTSLRAGTPGESGPTAWKHYGNSGRGTRYVRADQINVDNVAGLEVAWELSTGEIPEGSAADQNTPLQIGDTLYACTAHNKVIAIDADTGAERWRYDPKASSPMWQRCRGLGYFETSPSAGQPVDPATTCSSRIVLTTVDARLIQLDARSGALCDGFGEGGIVDLKQGMGEVKPGYWYQTSAPTVADDRIVVGGYHFDNQTVDTPSGVVRAFDATTGQLVWAWDIGAPDVSAAPPSTHSYTRGTPNVWAPPSFDAKLGLVYLPTGNATPDFWGGARTEAAEKYSSSIVAVDVHTGRARWHFQTVHHDLWDYDVASQPALQDVPDGKGGTVPALIQVTKRGQIFMLDRRDGTPLAEVVERAVAQHPAPGDFNAPTQPYSVGMPAIGAKRLTEADMWGATPVDQLWCRREFRRLRYTGDFTAPNTDRSLVWPGYGGGMTWGSVAIDEDQNLLIVNDMRHAMTMELVPRAEADPILALQEGQPQSHAPLSPMRGTPFASRGTQFFSPVGVPCVPPPLGTMTAIDLTTRKIAWQRPMGTIEDMGPMGINGLKIPIGMPTLGGPVVTSGGLIFFSGTMDHYLRAMDTQTGKELWRGRLPVAAQTTPMSYVSPKTGRQYVVVSAGGSYFSPRSDKIIAYALPEQKK